MLSAILDTIRGRPASSEATSRRRHTRRSRDRCVAMVGENMFPVVDWSIGGVQILCDERRFGLGDVTDIALKFQIRGEIVEIQNKAQVVRKNKGHVAFAFEPLNKDLRDRFQTVVDGFMAEEFAESQIS